MTSELSILVVYPFLPHYRREVFIALQRTGLMRVTFASDLEGRDGIETIEIAELDSHTRLKNKFMGRFLWQTELIGSILRGKYDAIVCLGDMSYLSTWVAALIQRVMGRKVLFWTIGWHRSEQGLVRLFRLIFYSLAHQLLLYGNDGRRIGIQMGFSNAKMTTIFNSVASATIEQSKLTDPKPEAEWDVIAVSRITAAKRFDILLEASEILSNSGFPIRILLVGDGAAKEGLVAQAEKLGVHLETLAAEYDANRLAELYRGSSLCVIPSYAGLSVIQSLQNGVPVITDDDADLAGPETEAIHEGETGTRYYAGSRTELAEAIRSWLHKVSDEKISIADACRAEIEQKWTAESQSHRIQRAVEKLFDIQEDTPE